MCVSRNQAKTLKMFTIQGVWTQNVMFWSSCVTWILNYWSFEQACRGPEYLVKIYAWRTIWNFFELRHPQQPQMKSVKIQSCICSIFIWFWTYTYKTQSMLSKIQQYFGYFWLLQSFISFCYTFEKNWWKRQKFTFQ